MCVRARARPQTWTNVYVYACMHAYIACMHADKGTESLLVAVVVVAVLLVFGLNVMLPKKNAACDQMGCIKVWDAKKSMQV